MQLSADEARRAIAQLTAVRLGLQLMRRQHRAPQQNDSVLDSTEEAANQLTQLLLSGMHATAAEMSSGTPVAHRVTAGRTHSRRHVRRPPGRSQLGRKVGSAAVRAITGVLHVGRRMINPIDV
jgi:hypothetical protein